MFIASVCPSVCLSVCLSVRLSVCLKPKFGRLKPKFDDDAEGGSAKRTRTLKNNFGPTLYVFYKNKLSWFQNYFFELD